jgi:hypothetical protein
MIKVSEIGHDANRLPNQGGKSRIVKKTPTATRRLSSQVIPDQGCPPAELTFCDGSIDVPGAESGEVEATGDGVGFGAGGGATTLLNASSAAFAAAFACAEDCVALF